MLLEVARGNFSYRIERSEHNDELEALVVLANMMTEELEGSIHHRYYINLHESYKHIAQMTFVLDLNFNIQNFNSMVSEILLFSPEELQGKLITDFLTEESKPVWEELLDIISEEEHYNHTVELCFKAKQFFIVPVICSVSNLTYSDNRAVVLVTAIETILQSAERIHELHRLINNQDNPDKNNLRILLTEADISKIAKAKDYITIHLKDINFSLKDLAHTLGTNEFKLKYGFKQLYGTTIFRFVQDERLRKASLLVQYSKLPFKTIAEMSGFKTAPHFSRVFKEKYGCTPSTLRKRSANKNK
ncbi:helix-turn-helix domain-containing protein [Sinomicrobium sp. M5D2P9]